jgi:hypothetical protein
MATRTVTRLPHQDHAFPDLDPAIHGIGVVAALLEAHAGDKAITDEGTITSMAHVLRQAQHSLLEWARAHDGGGTS